MSPSVLTTVSDHPSHLRSTLKPRGNRDSQAAPKYPRQLPESVEEMNPSGEANFRRLGNSYCSL